jgi:diguanylate cyclase (GGDEF)-like protein/putative nucleotidyltransferase with HDIG domain
MERKNIGIIVDNLYNYQWSILSGIFSAGENFNINLLTFIGKTLKSPYNFEKQGNIIYDFISKENIDGLIILSSAISSNVPLEETILFCQNFAKNIPTISIGLIIEGITSIIIDNKIGLKELLTHLICDHGYKNIAFVRGPINNKEADIRYETFIETLNQFGIEINPDYIFEGDFLRPSGIEAIKTFLDIRKLPISAIVFSNDDMALTALEELKKRNIEVPENIAITGFDDIEETRFVTPPLTTIQQPLFEMGWKAVELMISKLSGKRTPEEIILPTKLIIRNSCGCFPYLNFLENVNKEDIKDLQKLKDIKNKFIEYVKENLEEYEKISENIEQLYIFFIEDIFNENSYKFIKFLNEILKNAEKQNKDTNIYQKYITLLRKFLLPHINSKTLFRAENLWHYARIIISETSERIQGYMRIKTEFQSELLGGLGQELISKFDINHILVRLIEDFPNFGIKSFYLSLYEEKKKPYENAKLILGYRDGVIIEEKNFTYKIYDLIPKHLRPNRRSTMLIEPLYFQEVSLGLAIFELGYPRGTFYETLRALISASIQGSMLFKEKEKLIDELSILNDIGSSITSVIDMDVLLNLIVKEISKLFEFSSLSVIIFNLDDGKIEHIIQKGELVENLSLKDKYINWIVENKKPFLYSDTIGKFKSFLGIPIIIGNKIGGVIILIHLQKPYVYDEHSIKLLSTIGNFIAVALQNAKLFSEVTHLTVTDPLTDLFNRRFLEDTLQKEISRAQRFNHPLSILIIDVDNFKLFNDTYGHLFGDQILKTIANLIKNSCRKTDFVGRYGGDEFAVILPETSLNGAIKTAERIIKNLSKTPFYSPDGNNIPLKVSIGISSYPEDTNDPEKLFSYADTAMYKAKLNGGGQYATLTSKIEEREYKDFDIFMGLLYVVDNKDHYTFKHSQEVSKIATILGREIGLSKEDLEILELAGKLHDIGKIGIPSNILRKPASLTEEEWKIIKEHPRLGVLILSQLPKMEQLFHSILYHHERYDGKGYPNGKKGEEIPLFARILAIADAYSAMTSDRPYRKALSKEEIINELKKNAGKQFDPKLVEKFIELIEKGKIE